MILTSSKIKESLKNYLNKDTKISREVKKNKIFKIINGLYETDKNTPGYLLASSIYGPSYISFEYALSHYGLIPERVEVVTCASFDKKKKKMYKTIFGTFTYRDIPPLAYPEEIKLKEENGYSYQIATKEKALCDKIYTIKPLKNLTNLEKMLFDDLRIDKEEFNKLSAEKFDNLSRLYNSSNVTLLAKYKRRMKSE